MAMLPLRLQRILFRRLKRYNCVSDQHPKELEKFGGVAISSGGSYKSLQDWCYLPTSLFKADLKDNAEHPLILEITGAPHCCLANGPYLRTTDVFNGYPVYAQISHGEMVKENGGFETCIDSEELHDHLMSIAQNLADKQLRAGERLLVRQTNAWVVQSVTAYRGFSNRTGSPGFHLLHIPDDVRSQQKKPPTCFAGLDIQMKPIMEKCAVKLSPLLAKNQTPWPVKDHLKLNSKFLFDFGSRRIARPTVSKGTAYKPKATRDQEFHTDGPVGHDASSIWAADGSVNWKSDACLLSRLHCLSDDELSTLCSSRQIKLGDSRKHNVNALQNWFNEQPKTELPIPSSMFQSLSALFAFYPKTALGVPAKAGSSARWTSLKLTIPLGTAVLFRFDFFHHGWSCVDPADAEALPVHYRAHFYLFSGHLPAMPLYNFEAAIECVDDCDDVLLNICTYL